MTNDLIVARGMILKLEGENQQIVEENVNLTLMLHKLYSAVSNGDQQYLHETMNEARDLLLGTETRSDKLAPVIDYEESKTIISQLADALIWTSGSTDFAPGGQAREGWEKTAQPALEKARGFLGRD